MQTTRKVLAGVFFVVTLALGIVATASGSNAPEPAPERGPTTTFLVEDLVEGDRLVDLDRRSDV